MSPFSKYVKPSVVFGLSGIVSFTAFSYFNGNEKFFSKLVMPTLMKIADGEQAHNMAIFMSKYGLVPNAHKFKNESILNVKVFDRDFENPIGLAAGFDKNGEAIDGLFKIGFGFVEIGTITPLPQEGNPKPRVFRLPQDRAVINRYGFNSQGHEPVIERVKAFKNKPESSEKKILGINIGKNKLSQDAVKDYLDGLRAFAAYADYIVINISSPNTPGLRSLQNKQQLEQLIDPILDLRKQLSVNVPILVKIAPDLTDDEMVDIAQVSTRIGRSIDGLIVSNTTIQRPATLISKSKNETGGLSGRPLKSLSNRALKRMYELTDGKMTLIGVGGIESGKDALEKIKSGASLIQLYTSMVYNGPIIVNKIKKELISLLEDEGFSNISEAIGFHFKNKTPKK